MEISKSYKIERIDIMKLNKYTIKDLENKQPTLTYLLDNKYAKIGDMYELLEILVMVYEEDNLLDFLNDLEDRYNNKNQIKYFKENINNQPEEEQIKIFKNYKRNQQILIEQLLETLSSLDEDLVQEELKHYDFY